MNAEFSDQKALSDMKIWDMAGAIRSRNIEFAIRSAQSITATVALVASTQADLGMMTLPFVGFTGMAAVYTAYQAFTKRPTGRDFEHKLPVVGEEAQNFLKDKLEKDEFFGEVARPGEDGKWIVSRFTKGVETSREAMTPVQMAKLRNKMKDSLDPLLEIKMTDDDQVEIKYSTRGRLHNDEGAAAVKYKQSPEGTFEEVSRSYAIMGRKVTEEEYLADKRPAPKIGGELRV